MRNSTEQIENARHQYELQQSDATWIKVLAAQMGVGGDDTWGAPVHDEFLVSSADSYQLSFMIEPQLLWLIKKIYNGTDVNTL